VEELERNHHDKHVEALAAMPIIVTNKHKMAKYLEFVITDTGFTFARKTAHYTKRGILCGKRSEWA